MAVSQLASGTQAATVTTEHTLSTQSAQGAYSLIVDLSNMVSGDEVVLRVKIPGKTSGTSRVCFTGRYDYNGSQLTPIAISPVIAATAWVATLQQTDGTSRNFDWSVQGQVG